MSGADLNMSQETVEFNVSVIEANNNENDVIQTNRNKRKRGVMASFCDGDSSWEDIGSDDEFTLNVEVADDDDMIKNLL